MIKRLPFFLKATFLAFSMTLLGTQTYAQAYNFDGVADGSTGTLSNGWVGFPATGYRWEANTGTTGSSGTGPTTDHTLQTPAGIYMYSEASTPAILGDTAVLTSPNLILSSFTNPAIEFFYHKVGTSMGDLYIDILDGNTWVRGVDSIIGSVQGAETDPYLRRFINLGSYSDTIQFRFRAVCGTSWSGDMAIDGVTLLEAPLFDVGLTEPGILPIGYDTWPESQSPSLNFRGTLTNLGVSNLTNPTFKVTVGAYSDSVSTPSLPSTSSVTLSTSNPYTPPGLGDYSIQYTSFADQADQVASNNDGSGGFTISDSIYARDDSSSTGSLGIGTSTGVLGQTFEITTTDTLTSVSFFLNAPTLGDTTYADLYSHSGTPQSILASTEILVIPSGNPGWYTLAFPCPQILTPGTYFLGLNELGANLTLGTTPLNFIPNTTWVIFATNPWQPSEFYGFSVTYLLRMNLGNSTLPDLIQDATICANDTFIYSLPAGYTNSLWNGTDTSSTFPVTGAGSVTVSATSPNGCAVEDTVTVNTFPLPYAGSGTSSDACATSPAIDLYTLLTASPNLGGTWADDDNTGGLTGSMFTPGVPGAGTYSFTYTQTDTICGLSDTSIVNVTVSLPPNAGTTGSGVTNDCDPPIDLSTLLNGTPMMGGVWVDLNGAGGLTGSTFDASNTPAGTYDFGYVITNGCGSDTGIVTVQVSLCVGIDPAQLISFKVYPNPTGGAFNLEIPKVTAENLEVRILDLTGKTLVEINPDAATLINMDLGNMAKGIYLIELRQGDKVGRQQLILQ